jgi:TIR domain
MKQVFLSYARLDQAKAGRLYKDLAAASPLKIWYDREDLMSGMRWRPAIRKAIRDSDYFIALLSSRAVSRRGYRNSELREAIDVMREFPDDKVFLIPTRLDDCSMPLQEIEELTYADMFPRWKDGVVQLRKSLGLDRTIARAAVPRTTRRAAKPASSTPERHYRVALVDLDSRIPAIARIVRGLNNAQDFFGFTSAQIASPRAASLVIDGARQFHVDRTPSSFYRLVAPLKVDFVICLTQGMIAFTGPRGRVTPNYLAMASPVNDRVMFVSHALLKDYSRQAEVSFEVAIANLVTGQLVAYFLDIDYHGETRDCPMDFDDNLDDLVCALRAGRFCSHCATRLARNPQLSKAVNALIRWDR